MWRGADPATLRRRFEEDVAQRRDVVARETEVEDVGLDALADRGAGETVEALDEPPVERAVPEVFVVRVEGRDLPVEGELLLADAEERVQDERERAGAVRAAGAVDVDRVAGRVEEDAEGLRERLAPDFVLQALVRAHGDVHPRDGRAERRAGQAADLVVPAQVEVGADPERVEPERAVPVVDQRGARDEAVGYDEEPVDAVLVVGDLAGEQPVDRLRRGRAAAPAAKPGCACRGGRILRCWL